MIDSTRSDRMARLGPPLALMALIWFLSAQPDLSSGLGGWDLALRKLAHMTEFGLLFVLWRRGANAPVALVITLGWAGIDEFHQTFVDGRHGTPVDVAIDGVGVALAALVLRVRAARSSRAR